MKRLTTMLVPVAGIMALITHSVATGQDRTRERPQELRSLEAAQELSAEDDSDLDEESDSEDVADDDDDDDDDDDGDQDFSDDRFSETEEEDFANDDLDTVRSAAASESMAVWRVQVRFQTADVSKAGTDDDVKVELNGGNLTWVNYGRNDFERGDDFTYDLMLNGVTRLSDITRLKVSKTGSNGWCLQQIKLLVNDKVIYTKSFPSNHWFDTSDGRSNSYQTSGSTMRGSTSWKNYYSSQSSVYLDRTDMERLIEASMGHHMHGTGLSFSDDPKGRAFVEVSSVQCQLPDAPIVFRPCLGTVTRHVISDLDLRYNGGLDVDMEFVPMCLSGQLWFNMVAYGASADGGIPDAIDVVLDDLESDLSRTLTGIQSAIAPGGSCDDLDIEVSLDGSVLFSTPLNPF